MAYIQIGASAGATAAVALENMINTDVKLQLTYIDRWIKNLLANYGNTEEFEAKLEKYLQDHHDTNPNSDEFMSFIKDTFKDMGIVFSEADFQKKMGIQDAEQITFQGIESAATGAVTGLGIAAKIAGPRIFSAAKKAKAEQVIPKENLEKFIQNKITAKATISGANTNAPTAGLSEADKKTYFEVLKTKKLEDITYKDLKMAPTAPGLTEDSKVNNTLPGAKDTDLKHLEKELQKFVDEKQKIIDNAPVEQNTMFQWISSFEQLGRDTTQGAIKTSGEQNTLRQKSEFTRAEAVFRAMIDQLKGALDIILQMATSAMQNINTVAQQVAQMSSAS